MLKDYVSVLILIGVSMLIALLLTGCAAIQMKSSDLLVAQLAAKRAGYYVAKNNPSVAPKVILVAQGILAEKDADAVKIALNMGAGELAKMFPDDPFLADDLKLVASSLQIDVPTVNLDMAQVGPILDAFITGLKAGAGAK